MALSRNHLLLTFALTSIFLISSISGGIRASSSLEDEEELRKMVLGSRPPACVNKCMSCRPCEATLVIPPRQTKKWGLSSHREDNSYYLLSWKCRCGNKLYQP
ncbi:EPIDERMAL PATTERNING FACTOR-like protein 6 [Salvia divinorum]|uniref:Epidermal patterning factor-like protein n=1 Tax=Salvia divinorum TaxID=28513 RepID=A0ABD1I990_SALDI